MRRMKQDSWKTNNDDVMSQKISVQFRKGGKNIWDF